MFEFARLEETLKALPRRPKILLVDVPLDDPPADGATTRHGPGFATVAWRDGKSYAFGGRLQRAAVAVLWQAYHDGTPDVPEALILREIESDTTELRQLFRGHKAWGTLIQRSSLHDGPVGCYRLV